jgi:RNA polymerase sigma-70 factor (ECF subfamily)
MTTTVAAGLADAFDAHRRYLWSLAYRLTGSAADAEDIVQETFVRALERPPARTDEPWRPWLVRVAVNLGRDLLRRRRRRGYPGPWLPAPVETGEADPPSFDPPDLAGLPSARYDLVESVSMAFLLALEALSPAQRAVLLLRDVFDYSVREAAEALDMSEANVKTTHLRARRAMAAYEAARRAPSRDLRERTAGVLVRFLTALSEGDAATVESLLADAVKARTDAAGEFVAATVMVAGRQRVAQLLLGIAAKGGRAYRAEMRMLNGLPAALLVADVAPPGRAPRSTFQVLLDAEGRIVEVLAVLASRKLTGVRWTPAGS